MEEVKYRAKYNCKKCHGRGHLGFNITHQAYIKCRCVRPETEDEKKFRLIKEAGRE